MQRSEIITGSIVLGIGFVFLIGAIFNINIWGLICPASLIGLGILLIYRTRQNPREGELSIKFVGNINRDGVWQPQNEETLGFVLESRLDFTEADLPDGQTILQTSAFVNDIKATFSSDVGVAIHSIAFMTDSRVQNERRETFFIPFNWQSSNFENAPKKVLLKSTCFVSEIKVEIVAV